MAALPRASCVRMDPKGSPIGEARYTFFATGSRDRSGVRSSGGAWRNDIARLEISGERSAGAVQLLDKRWRRRAIGIVSGSTNDTAQAAAGIDILPHPGAGAVRRRAAGRSRRAAQAITQFLDQKLPMIVLADVWHAVAEIRERIAAWIEQGGGAGAFCRPRLAQADDDLVPVKLRRGGRSLGGSLTWESRSTLPRSRPMDRFAGLPVPKDITVSRKVLAEPDAVLRPRAGPRWRMEPRW